ncbi:MAG: hypothetical protein P1P65_03870 [Treponema sp.]
MLIAEYDYDTDIAVQRQESLMIGRQEGIQVGRQEGFADGLYQSKLETAAAFKRLGIDIAKIAAGTGLSKEETVMILLVLLLLLMSRRLKRY